MKNSFLFFMIVLILSCGNTKEIVSKRNAEILQNDSTEVVKTFTKENSVSFKNDSINNIKASISEQKNESDQVLTKDTTTVHDIWNTLLKKYVSDNGNVDYEGFKTNRATLNDYLKVLDTTLPDENTSEPYNLAFWINAYNAMTIDLILRHYPIKSIKDIKDPWGQRYWKLGETWYNLNDIEHNILRKMNEPRIHFAIVCASFSCPKLANEAYNSIELESQLTAATKVFLNDDSKNSISYENLELSKIFQWFGKDFKQNGSLIDFLHKYSGIEISSKAKKEFKDYNWNLNH